MKTTTPKDILQNILKGFIPHFADEKTCDKIIAASMQNGNLLSSLTAGVRMKNKLRNKQSISLLLCIDARTVHHISHEDNEAMKELLEVLHAELQNMIVIAKHSP